MMADGAEEADCEPTVVMNSVMLCHISSLSKPRAVLPLEGRVCRKSSTGANGVRPLHPHRASE